MQHMHILIRKDAQMLNPGDVIRIPCGLYDHLAIVSDKTEYGRPYLISCSHRTGEVREELWDVVVGNQRWRHVGAIGSNNPAEILRRARSKIGSRWDLFSWNCEHFVNWACGQPSTSPQLTAAIVGLSVFAIIAFGTRRAA